MPVATSQKEKTRKKRTNKKCLYKTIEVNFADWPVMDFLASQHYGIVDKMKRTGERLYDKRYSIKYQYRQILTQWIKMYIKTYSHATNPSDWTITFQPAILIDSRSWFCSYQALYTRSLNYVPWAYNIQNQTNRVICNQISLSAKAEGKKKLHVLWVLNIYIYRGH